MSYQALLSEKLNLTKDRDVFSAGEVRDMLLDLWLATQQEGINELSDAQ